MNTAANEIGRKVNNIFREDSRNEQLNNLHNRIARLCAAADVTPPEYGKQIPLSKLDAALSGMSINERMTIKAALKSADLIAVGE